MLDRFGLHCKITTITDLAERVEIVERRDEFDRSPAAFESRFNTEQQRIRKQLLQGRALIERAKLDRVLLVRVAELCALLGIDGHRGELTLARAARARAALDGRASVDPDDVRRVAVMALRHRLRKGPLDNVDSGVRIEQAVDKVLDGRGSLRGVSD